MFCTQCGTPFELGQNFCKHCGARVNQQPDLQTPTETAKRETTQATIAPEARAKSVAKATDDALRLSTSRERRGTSMSVLGWGVSCATPRRQRGDLLRNRSASPASKAENSDVADVPASRTQVPSARDGGKKAKNSSRIR